MSCFLVTFSVFLVNFWSIICQFLSNFWQFFPQFFYKMFCQFNYLLNYCWKSIVKSIIFSIIAWCGLVKPGFESSLNPSLDTEAEGLSRVWTQVYNWPIRGSLLDPCPCLDYVIVIKNFLNLEGHQNWSYLTATASQAQHYMVSTPLKLFVPQIQHSSH